MQELLRFAMFVMALAFCLEPLAHAQQPEIAPAAAPARAAPAEVKVGFYINDIQSIDLHNYSFVADVYLWFRDTDGEIVPGKSFEWMNMFAPDDHVQTDIYPEPVRQPDGSDYQVFRHQGPFAAKFSVKTYPFDKHFLTIEIEDQEWDANNLVYSPDAVTLNPDISLPGFEIGAPTLKVLNRPYPTNFGEIGTPEPEAYSRAIISIPISRPVASGVTKARCRCSSSCSSPPPPCC